MTKNKMREVAQLLGVELNEEFEIKEKPNKSYKITKGYILNEQGVCCSSVLVKLLNGNFRIKRPILDKVEKQYLENVLRPFKNKVNYIKKNVKSDYSKEWIHINLGDIVFNLPYFEKGKMYKGIKLEKEYTLEELGLFKD